MCREVLIEQLEFILGSEDETEVCNVANFIEKYYVPKTAVPDSSLSDRIEGLAMAMTIERGWSVKMCFEHAEAFFEAADARRK